ncbi:MAG: hypothetical protein AAF206_26955, partial [Bacteroidota bacterium]
CKSIRQVSLARDTRAEQLLAQGKRALQNKQYDAALDAFETVYQRPFSQSTTAAIYLSGLTAYYLQYDDIVERRFDELIRDYPKSRYIEEAQYHLALMDVRKRNLKTRLEGMRELERIATSATDKSLAKTAADYIDEKLYNGDDVELVEALYSQSSGRLKQKTLEGLALRDLEAGDPIKAKARYEQYLQTGGKTSAMLEKVLPESVGPAIRTPKEPNIIKLALFLPFNLHDSRFRYSADIPARSRRALEFYEGFQIAIDQHKEAGNKQVYLHLVDSRRDTARVRTEMARLDSIGPDVVVGDLFNAESRILAEWSESHKIPQIIPISASSSLVEEKSFSFLAHPSALTHGARLAEYARLELELNSVSVFADGTMGTGQLFDGFTQTFIDLGGTIDTLTFDPRDEDYTNEEIPDLVDDIRTEGVYIPLIGNEEAAGLIINLLKKENRDELVVMGSPHFLTRYNTLSRDVKEGFGLIFTASHLPNKSLPAFDYLERIYRTKFRLVPSESVVQGYDLATYLLYVMDRYDHNLGVPLEMFFRVQPRFESIHLNYHFKSNQSNQEVNIGRFTEDGIESLNRDFGQDEEVDGIDDRD